MLEYCHILERFISYQIHTLISLFESLRNGHVRAPISSSLLLKVQQLWSESKAFSFVPEFYIGF
jgi:hypothetical protein